MSQPIFIHNAPYVVYSTWRKPIATPDDSLVTGEVMTEVLAFVFRWCIQRGLATPVAKDSGYMTSEYRANISENMAVFSSRIYTTNMVTMCQGPVLDGFMKSFRDGLDHNWRSDVFALMTAIVMMFEERVVDAVVNRVMSAMSVIPNPDATITWEELHKTHPYMWVIFLINRALIQFTDPPVPKKI